MSVKYRSPPCLSKWENHQPKEETFSFPSGDFSANSEFFVLVGVLCWLYCFAT